MPAFDGAPFARRPVISPGDARRIGATVVVRPQDRQRTGGHESGVHDRERGELGAILRVSALIMIAALAIGSALGWLVASGHVRFVF